MNESGKIVKLSRGQGIIRGLGTELIRANEKNFKKVQKSLQKGIDKGIEMWYNTEAVAQDSERSLKIEQQEISTKQL